VHACLPRATEHVLHCRTSPRSDPALELRPRHLIVMPPSVMQPSAPGGFGSVVDGLVLARRADGVRAIPAAGRLTHYQNERIAR